MRDGRPSGCPLSPRQYEAVLGVIRGQAYKTVAVEMHVTPCTARTYIHAAYHRLAVNSAAQARTVMIREGWLTLAETLLPDDALPLIDQTSPTYTRISRRGYRNWLPTPAQRLYLDAFDRLLSERTAYRRSRVGGCRHIVYFEREIPALPNRANALDGMIAKIAPVICTRSQLDVLQAVCSYDLD